MPTTGHWVRRGSTIVLYGAEGDRGDDDVMLEDPLAREEAFETDMAMLRRGSRGPAVRDLQTRLKALGFDPGPVDGVFGARTEAAIKSLQRARGLTADGTFDYRTFSGMSSDGAPRPSSPPVTPGADPAIEKLNLAEPARSAAYQVKRAHPWVAFTSGRRDVAGQASAMAGNVILNRKWIAQTYANNPVSQAAQRWVDGHPEARTKQAITDGLLGVFRGFPDSQLARLSRHLGGLAFDIQPVSSKLSVIAPTIRSLPGLRTFLTTEGGLDRWHVDF